ncbi:Kynurenine formamidase [Microsporum canis]
MAAVESCYEKYTYGDHYLQNVYVHIPPSPAPVESGFWIVYGAPLPDANRYIHGGAWRDPDILAPSFKATQDNLLAGSNTEVTRSIAGIASIDYRLSPHPNFPQDAGSVDAREYRNAKRPEHITDVQKALALLQEKYAFGERYVLIGHSCGGTMSFQVVMDRVLRAEEVVRPVAIVCVAGVTHMPLLVETMAHVPAYREFIADAFGGEDTWRLASPAMDVTAGGVVDSWKNGRLAVVARSVNDEALPGNQLAPMKEALAPWAAAAEAGKERRVKIIEDMVDTHDGMWTSGKEVAAVISTAIKELQDMKL